MLGQVRVIQSLTGANNSTQYVALIGYRSLLTGLDETIKIEVGLREPLLLPVEERAAHTLLLDPVSRGPMVPAVNVPCIARLEAFAEKFRAALSRREVAIRSAQFDRLGPGIGRFGRLRCLKCDRQGAIGTRSQYRLLNRRLFGDAHGLARRRFGLGVAVLLGLHFGQAAQAQGLVAAIRAERLAERGDGLLHELLGLVEFSAGEEDPGESHFHQGDVGMLGRTQRAQAIQGIACELLGGAAVVSLHGAGRARLKDDGVGVVASECAFGE